MDVSKRWKNLGKSVKDPTVLNEVLEEEIILAVRESRRAGFTDESAVLIAVICEYMSEHRPEMVIDFLEHLTCRIVD
jgi:hypothetical protein